MTMAAFIRENRDELIAAVRSVCDNCAVGDDDLEEWIENDEGLYLWAQSAGVEL